MKLGIKTGKGFYDYSMEFSKGEFDAAAQDRDRALLNLLKALCPRTSKGELS